MRYVDMEKKGLCNRGSSTSYEETVDTAPTNTPCTVAEEDTTSCKTSIPLASCVISAYSHMLT